MESFDRENAFGIRQQQHMHCHHKIHTQNACHNIPRGKTQKAFLQLLTTLTATNVDTAVAACTSLGSRLEDGHAQCTGSTSRKTGTVRRTARRPCFSLTIFSVTVQLWT